MLNELYLSDFKMLTLDLCAISASTGDSTCHLLGQRIYTQLALHGYGQITALTNSGLRMARWQKRKSSGIHDSQTLDANNLSLGVNHSHWVVNLPHGTGARSMIDSVETLPDDLLNLSVRLNLRTRERLLADDKRFHRVGVPELAGPFKPSNGNLDVSRVGKPVGVDDRLNGRVGGRDGEVAS